MLQRIANRRSSGARQRRQPVTEARPDSGCRARPGMTCNVGENYRLALLRRAGSSGDDAVDSVALLVEAGDQRAFEYAATRQLDAQRIDEAAVHQDLVVHMRAGREAGRADIADHLALPYARARLCRACERRHVAVGGLVAIGVLDLDVFAVARFPADLLDGAVAGGVDRCAERRGPVDAGVHLEVAEQWMIAGAEA